MNNSSAQRQEEIAAPNGAVSDMESLLREYTVKQPVATELSIQMQIGKELGSMILENQTNAREILTKFTEMAPTKFERVMQKRPTTLDETTREPVGSSPQLHLVKAQEQAEDDPAILVTNDHVRMSVYMRTARELMTKLHGMPYTEYQQFRDEFNDKMYDELRDNDKQLQQSRLLTEKSVDDSSGLKLTNLKEQKPTKVVKDAIDVLTFGDFTKRLENTIVNMATMKVVTDSNL